MVCAEFFLMAIFEAVQAESLINYWACWMYWMPVNNGVENNVYAVLFITIFYLKSIWLIFLDRRKIFYVITKIWPL